VNDVILTVASYGQRLPSAAVVRYTELAALEIEQADLGPYGWAERRSSAAAASESGPAEPAALASAGRGVER
jgi:hypothetical protein